MKKIIVHKLALKLTRHGNQSLIKIFQVCILNLLLVIIISFSSQFALASESKSLITNGSASRAYLAQANNTCAPVTANRIYRFIQGEDDCLVAMTTSEIEENLNDPFAENILRANKFPENVSEIVQEIDAVNALERCICQRMRAATTQRPFTRRSRRGFFMSNRAIYSRLKGV